MHGERLAASSSLSGMQVTRGNTMGRALANIGIACVDYDHSVFTRVGSWKVWSWVECFVRGIPILLVCE